MSTELIERLLRDVAIEWNARAFDRERPYTFAAVSFAVPPYDEIVIVLARGSVTAEVREFVESTLGGRVSDAPPDGPRRALVPPSSLRDAD